jgi:hypothetical protein
LESATVALAEYSRQLAAEYEPAGPHTYLGLQCSPPLAALVQQLKLTRGMGLLVDAVLSGSPAQLAGLKRHDLLEKLDDQLLVNSEQLTALIRNRQPGERVKLALVRDGRLLVVEVTLARHDPQPPQDSDDAQAQRASDAEPQTAAERWKENRLAQASSAQVSDEVFVRRLYLDLLGIPPTPAERKRFLEDENSHKRAALIESLLTQPEAVSRLSGQAAARWVDPVHRLTLSSPDGHWHLRAETAQGEKLFDGLVDTDQQRQALPEEVSKKLRVMQGRLAAEEFIGSDASSDAADSEEVLSRPIAKVDLQQVTLAEAVERLRAQTGANLVLNTKALRQAGVDLDEKFSLSLADVRLSTVLKTLLALAAEDMPLVYQVEDEVILLTASSPSSDMQ